MREKKELIKEVYTELVDCYKKRIEELDNQIETLEKEKIKYEILIQIQMYSGLPYEDYNKLKDETIKKQSDVRIEGNIIDNELFQLQEHKRHWIKD